MLHLERSIKAHGHGGLRRPNGQENTYPQQTGCATKSQWSNDCHPQYVASNNCTSYFPTNAELTYWQNRAKRCKECEKLPSHGLSFFCRSKFNKNLQTNRMKANESRYSMVKKWTKSANWIFWVAHFAETPSSSQDPAKVVDPKAAALAFQEKRCEYSKIIKSKGKSLRPLSSKQLSKSFKPVSSWCCFRLVAFQRLDEMLASCCSSSMSGSMPMSFKMIP